MTLSTSSTDGPKPPDASSPFRLSKLDIPQPHLIDGIKLKVFGNTVSLFYSVQESTAPTGYKMVIHTAFIPDLPASKVINTVNKLLPARARWDVRRNDSGDYEFVFEQIGGAINCLMYRDAAGIDSRISVSYPFESFFRPHFVRGRSGAQPQIAATVDKKKAVSFPPTAHLKPSHYEALTECAEAVVGHGPQDWVLVKDISSGPSQFNILPGKLSIVWLPLSTEEKKPQKIPFPDFVAFEFDATNLRDDVMIFATSKPAVLLRASAPAKPIHLAASERILLSKLCCPTLVVGSEFVHIAAIANPGTKAAAVLYGEIPISQLLDF